MNLREHAIEITVKEFEIESPGGNRYLCSPKQLGSGGFAQVFLGRDLQQNRPVAIKIVDRTTLQSRQYHQQEKDIFRKVKHTNIVELYDLIEDVTFQMDYFVMEFCSGGSLESVNNLTEKALKKVLVQIVQGLNYLSESRIFHRDIKPQNILLTHTDIEKATIKLCDFGLAKQLDIGQNVAESFVGTPIYFAPERLKRSEYGESGDIWSLGCVGYELITGKKYVIASTEQQIYQALCSKEKLDLPPNISDDCFDLFSQMLQPNPTHRIASFSELLRHKFLQGEILKAVRSIATGEKFWFKMEFSRDYTVQDLKEGIEDISQIPIQHQLILQGDKGTPIKDKQKLTEFTLVELWLLDNRSGRLANVQVSTPDIVPMDEFQVTPESINLKYFTSLCEQHQEIYPAAHKLYERLLALINLYEFRADGAILLEFCYQNSASKFTQKQKRIENISLDNPEHFNYKLENALTRLKEVTVETKRGVQSLNDLVDPTLKLKAATYSEKYNTFQESFKLCKEKTMLLDQTSDNYLQVQKNNPLMQTMMLSLTDEGRPKDNIIKIQELRLEVDTHFNNIRDISLARKLTDFEKAWNSSDPDRQVEMEEIFKSAVGILTFCRNSFEVLKKLQAETVQQINEATKSMKKNLIYLDHIRNQKGQLKTTFKQFNELQTVYKEIELKIFNLPVTWIEYQSEKWTQSEFTELLQKKRMEATKVLNELIMQEMSRRQNIIQTKFPHGSLPHELQINLKGSIPLISFSDQNQQNEMKKAREEIDELKKKLKESQTDVLILKGDLKQTEEQLHDTKRQLTEISQQSKVGEQTSQSMREKLENAQHENQEMKKEVSQLKQDIINLKENSQTGVNVQEYSKLQKDFEDLLSRHKQAQCPLCRKIFPVDKIESHAANCLGCQQ